MLNPFPFLLDFGIVAPLIIRAILGFTVIHLGLAKFRGEKERWALSFEALGVRPGVQMARVFGTIEIIGGLALIVGFFTQIAALIFSALTLVALFIEYRTPPVLPRTLPFYLLLFAMSLSLLLSGAGFYALDLPL